MRTFAAAGAVAALLFLQPALARAQTKADFGTRGEFVLSADRLVPLFSWTRVAQDDLPPLGMGVTNSFTSRSQTAFSFFWGSNEQPQAAFFTVPRVGFDYVVIPNLTIGGDVAVFFTVGSNASAETDFANGSSQSTSGDNGGFFLFGIAPRAGYVLRLSDLFALWLRGGFSFYTGTTSNPQLMNGTSSHDSVDQFAIDLEPQVVFTPVPHFGLTAAIDGDIPLVGRHWHTTFAADGTSTALSASSSSAFVGLTLGMLGYF
jgi:hypothetical protein